MKRLLQIILTISVLNISAQAQRIDSLFLSASMIKLQHAKEYTLKVANLMPDSKYGFKPSKEEMSFGEQLLHLAANMGWLSSTYLSNSVNPVTDKDMKREKKEEILAALNRSYDFALNILKQFPSAQLADTVSFFVGPLNKLQIINLLNDHQTHHRAQMLVYLRLNGIKPPDYVGW